MGHIRTRRSGSPGVLGSANPRSVNAAPVARTSVVATKPITVAKSIVRDEWIAIPDGGTWARSARIAHV